MSSIKEYRCEVCRTVTGIPVHWFAIQCGTSHLTVFRWSAELANIPGVRHTCGEAHAEVYISRWFESVCSPPAPDYSSMPSSPTSA